MMRGDFMLYVMSDVHGCFRTFEKMLKKIGFKPSDQLYILGDVIDRGAYGVDMLRHVMAQSNVKMLMGNHEYLMLDMLRYNGRLHDIREIECWTDDNGGAPTLKALRALPKGGMDEILDFVAALPFEDALEINGKKYHLVHGRPHLTNAEKEIIESHRFDMHDSLYEHFKCQLELVWGHFLPHIIKRDEKFIFGRTITFRYSDELPSRILYRNGNIGLDCGCARRDRLGRLAALRLDDMKEFYEPIDPRDVPGGKLKDTGGAAGLPRRNSRDSSVNYPYPKG
jgi:serine/threonine protein phosphatase 1